MKSKAITGLLLAGILLLSGCRTAGPVSSLTGSSAAGTTVPVSSGPSSGEIKEELLGSLVSSLDPEGQARADEGFLDWLEERYGQEILIRLRDKLAAGSWEKEDWHRLTGSTLLVLADAYTGRTKDDTVRTVPDTADGTAVIQVVGDVSLADNWVIMPAYDERKQGLDGILSKATVTELQSADILLVNNEFTFSDRGSPLPRKMYTFRGTPNRVGIYKELGVDLVSLANNHAYDFGTDAFLDTLDTLKGADIPYMGGGKNLEEAMRPVYFIMNGRKIAFVAATRAEKFILTPEAGETSPGVLRTYDTARFLEVIREARQKSDIVIAYVHWGKEDSHSLEDVQLKAGREYIDAGADVVVGAHAHVLQGVEFYKNKPLVYNLGNFLFNAKTVDTGILKIHVDGEGTLSYEFQPAIQKDCYTEIVDGEERARILRFMERISIGTTFGEDGFFTPAA